MSLLGPSIDATRMQQLLAAGANVDEVGVMGLTPVHFACINGHIDCVQLLVAP